MNDHKIKALLLTIFTTLFLISGVSPGYAINLNEVQKLLPGDGEQANDFFGASISSQGNTAVIGAPTNWGRDGAGSAYVFVRDNTGKWHEKQKLTASDASQGDALGWSVSLSGDTVILGAWRETTNGYESGAAYVYVRDAAGVLA